MEQLKRIKSFIAPIKNLDFKIYSLESSKLFLFNEKYSLKELKSYPISSIPITNIYWSFNNKSLGDYCRDLSQSIENIETSIPQVANSFKDKSAVVKFIEPIINDLKSIIEYKGNFKDSLRIVTSLSQDNPAIPLLDASFSKIFEFREKKIKDLIKSIEDDYIFRIPKKKAAKIIRVIEPKEGHLRRVRMEGFCWNKKRNLIEDLVILHTYLREYDFIDKNTSIKVLQDALGCCFIDEPLGIKWTKKVKGKLSKGLLFHFIDQLEHFNLISTTYQNFELFNKLHIIFCSPSGDELRNLEVSKSQWLNQRKLNKTPQELALDNILHTLLYKESQ